jgi:hypothetical protein
MGAMAKSTGCVRRRAAKRAVLSALAAAVSLGGCDAGRTKIIGGDYPAPTCAAVAAPPGGVDAFYQKYRDANGIPVLSSAAVADTALASACVVVVRMLSARDDVRQTMIAQQMRVALIARDQVTTDLPEYRNLYEIFPDDNDWDALRGVGGTMLIPVSSAGEENVLCLDDDPNAGQNMLVHTFATAVVVGLAATESTFAARLQAARDGAMAAGLWQGTMALKDPIQYFAAGVEDWFDTSPDVSPPDGVHNEINTREELQAYDPTLASLVKESMPNDGWRPKCP